VKRRKLPVGIQNLREIREDGCYYVDKTPHIERLIREGKHYFLSRPRRFGKSLLIDTIKELFEGNEALFRGLHIHERWNWERRHPVVRLSFGGAGFRKAGRLDVHLAAQLDRLERGVPLEFRYERPPERFAHLIRTLHEQTGRRVVVLVDEYDKPILDSLTAGDADLARENRDALRSFYGNVKECDAHIRLSLLTGVSKFTKVSLFSELNNLDDITLDPRYATICGYTENDLDEVFAPELPGLDRETIRDWYNGYNWRGREKVYNPFGILRLFRKREFGAYWFETGSPAFLVETVRERGVRSIDLSSLTASEALLSAFDVDQMSTEALLFQTGYVTIAEERRVRDGRIAYRLGYPNREVRESLNQRLLMAAGWEATWSCTSLDRLYDRLEAADFTGLEQHFRSLFAGIPYNWHTRNEIARFEGYWASVMYAHFAALGLNLTAEDASAAGRLDLAVLVSGHVYLFEFKVTEQAGEGRAMAQLAARGYAEKYLDSGEPIHLVGVEFSAEQRRLVRFEAKTL